MSVRPLPVDAVSRMVSVRLTAVQRAELDRLARDADRPRAQLIRYALTALLESGCAGRCVSMPEASGVELEHTAVRLPTDLAHAVHEHAQACGVSTSQVVRVAVSAWLAEVSSIALQRGLGRVRG